MTDLDQELDQLMHRSHIIAEDIKALTLRHTEEVLERLKEKAEFDLMSETGEITKKRLLDVKHIEAELAALRGEAQ